MARERIVVTAGASAGCVLTILAAFDPGARVAVATPGYPCYEQIISSLGLDAVPVRVGDHNGYLLGPDDLDQAVRSGGPIDGVMVASPANPTGAVYDRARLEALVRWCAEHEVRLICDEIYHGITFGPPAPSATACDADVVVIGSFSKYFSMTGWRLGWLILPTSLVEPVDRLAQNLYLAPPTLAQHVALAAFDATDELDAHVTRYATNRTVLVDALAAIGLDHHAPCDGAFYLYTDVSRFGIDSADLVDTWLNDLGVAASPGIDFDHTDGGDWVRFSLAGSVADVTEAARRLVAWGHATLDGRRG